MVVSDVVESVLADWLVVVALCVELERLVRLVSVVDVVLLLVVDAD